MADSRYPELPELQIVAADYAADSAAIRKVRFTVFVDEQAVPAALEMDDRDAHCFHVLAFDRDGDGAGDGYGVPIGTGRIDMDDGGRIGRMAVLAAYRQRGVGQALLNALHAHALANDASAVWCHAQTAALNFYSRAGYVAEGEVFEEAGIEHITMRCRLRP